MAERVLVDTSAFYAIYSASDQYHHRASAAYGRLADGGQELWTTSYVLVETVALMHRRLGFEVVQEFSEWQRRSNLQVLWIDGSIHDAAWERLIDRRGTGLSLVDWTIVVASREMGAPVFTFDGGFANEGLAVVPR